jgi:hypothetical protein
VSSRNPAGDERRGADWHAPEKEAAIAFFVQRPRLSHHATIEQLVIGNSSQREPEDELERG